MNIHQLINMSFNPDLKKAQSYIFMEYDKMISLTNMFQQLLSAEILFE